MAEARPHAVPAGGSVDDVIRRATRQLAAAGIEGAGRDARLLLAAALGVGSGDLILSAGEPVPAAAKATFAAMLQRRTRHEPVARILGIRDFYGRPFVVTPDVLDPRPDSETLIEAALEIVDLEGWRQRPLRIIDVGTGSGCLLATLLAELPAATGLGTDISPAALVVAARNAAALGVADRAQFAAGRSLDSACGIFDLLVCNPPYIATHDIDGLAADVRAYDPISALDGGADGLDVYHQLAPRLAAVVPDGWAVFEVGAGQAEDVVGILAAVGSGRHRMWPDLDGRSRCVAFSLRP